MSEPKYCVYEAINQALGEAVVGVSAAADAMEISAQHQRTAPVWMRHWKPGQAEYRIVVSGLAAQEAIAFASTHSRSASLGSLRVYVTS